MKTKVNKETILTLYLTSVLTITFVVTTALSSSVDTMVVVYGSTPTVDGLTEDNEWNDASIVTITVTAGANCTVYFKQDGVNLYFGFNIPDTTYNASDCCGIIFDVDFDQHTSLQPDDIWLHISRQGSRKEKNVTFGGWYPTSVLGWTAEAGSTASGWQSEYSISHSKLDITAGTEKTLGVNFLIVDNDVEKGWYTWPSPWISKPATWGDMTADTTPATVSVVSPENKTYTVDDIPLTFAVSESTSWIGYSLDGQKNVTISGNTTIEGLSDGPHSLIIYAKDTSANTGASGTIYFSISTQQAEPFSKWIIAAIVVIAGGGAALFVYSTRVKKAP